MNMTRKELTPVPERRSASQWRTGGGLTAEKGKFSGGANSSFVVSDHFTIVIPLSIQTHFILA
jgi:hypothetical protein